ALFLAGFFAITGSPPFGPFLSEFTILNAAISSRQYAAATLFLFMLVIVFVGMGATVLAVVQGRPADDARPTTFRDGIASTAPSIILMAAVLMLGVYVPRPLDALLHDAAAAVEGVR